MHFFERQPREQSRTLLASSAGQNPKPSSRLVAKAGLLPGEGVVFDRIGVANFIDLEKNRLTASLSKSLKSNALSNLLDADLPAKVTVSGKLGNVWYDSFDFAPIGKLGLTVRLLDLGAADSRQGGFLRFKAATRTNGRADHGFEIDRRVAIMNLPSTTLYGNVAYRTNNQANGVWKTTSSFGVHQGLHFAGMRCAFRVGMTPEGQLFTDLRL